MYYDYHVHTLFSEDSEMKLEEACEAAIEKNIIEMAVTDHLDIDYPDRSITFDLDYPAYSEAIDKAKKKYREQLNIIKGLEIGLQPHIMEECRQFLSGKDFQFIIASIHAARKLDLHSGEFSSGKSRKTTYREYLEEVYLCIKEFEQFHVLGHIDLIRRYGGYEDTSMKYPDFPDELDEIFRHLIYNGKGMEINTSGYRYNLGSTLPDLDLLKRYRELGGEILTIGSDAHTPYQLAEHFTLAYTMADKAGFRYLTRFPRGKPEFVKLIR